MTIRAEEVCRKMTTRYIKGLEDAGVPPEILSKLKDAYYNRCVEAWTKNYIAGLARFAGLSAETVSKKGKKK